MINGALDPAPLTLRVGVPHRLRIVNITASRPGIRVELHRDTSVVEWRLLARDGAELPSHRQVKRPAIWPISIGQTVDVELTPASTEPLRFLVRAANGVPIGSMILRPSN